MSSTNRGYDRHATDYYVTPQQPIKDFLNDWFLDLQKSDEERHIGDSPDKVKWFDPCAGGDDNHPMSYPAVIYDAFQPETIATLDLRENSRAERKGDYLVEKITPEYYDVIITNPPFYLAKEIIEKALNDVRDGGYVVMLLRLNFFGSNGRKQFLQDNMPKWTYVHSKRMSFTDDGKTDSIEYMHAVWQKGYKAEHTKLKII